MNLKNKPIKLLWQFLFLSLFIVAGAHAENDQRSDDIKQVLAQQQTAWNQGDIAGYMQGYWNSPELTFVSGGSITHGWQQTLDRYLKRYDSKEKVGHLNFEELTVEHLSDDHSLAAGIWRLNRNNGETWGRFSLVFKKIDSRWLIVYDHTSTN